MRDRFFSRGPNRAAWGVVAATGVLSVLLCGCAPEVDAQVARDSLVEVTEDPAPPTAAQELDATVLPEPIVEPLDCSDTLVITARGTGEPAVGQLVSPVARNIARALPGETSTVDVDYAADTDVQEGGTRGVRWLIDTLNVQADACPAQQTVLLGYSQGALIIGDVLAAPEQRMVGGTVGELTPDATALVGAVVMYGDPRFVGTEPFDVGSYDPALNGILPRPVGSLDTFADRIQDFCVAGDFVCQSSLTGVDEMPHTEYYSNGMQQDGAEWVIRQLDSDSADSNTSDSDRRSSDRENPVTRLR